MVIGHLQLVRAQSLYPALNGLAAMQSKFNMVKNKLFYQFLNQYYQYYEVSIAAFCRILY